MTKLKHFVAGEPGFVEQLNELVDAVNSFRDELENKADKRKSAASK